MVSLNSSSLIHTVNTTFMLETSDLGGRSNAINTCNHIGLVVQSVNEVRRYAGAANNVTAFMDLVRNVPANMKNDTISFLCLDNEGVYTEFADKCIMTRYNLTQATKDILGNNPYLGPEFILQNYTIPAGEQMFVASPLNGKYGCYGVATIDWLYPGDKSNHTLSDKFYTNEQLIDGLMNIPNATSASNLSITCEAFGQSSWLGRCDHNFSLHNAHVSIPLTLLLVSMGVLFVNGLFA